MLNHNLVIWAVLIPFIAEYLGLERTLHLLLSILIVIFYILRLKYAEMDSKSLESLKLSSLIGLICYSISISLKADNLLIFEYSADIIMSILSLVICYSSFKLIVQKKQK